MAFPRRSILTLAACWLAATSAQGSFHFMQIEQIIGGVNGDVTAQAIQLRMRTAGQNHVSPSRLTVVDAAGANSVLLEDISTSVPNGHAGRRLLLTTPNFANYTNIPLVSDFTMDPIPASYLAAGQVRFTDDFSTILWSLGWGGAGYTGSTTGSLTNDSNGDFGPPAAIALPSTSLQALQFTGAASAPSTTNLADYALTAGAATFINNANTSFTLVARTFDSADFDVDGDVDGDDLTQWRGDMGANALSDADGDNDSDGNDFLAWQQQVGSAPAVAAVDAVPEPSSAAIIAFHFTAAVASRIRRRSAARGSNGSSA